MCDVFMCDACVVVCIMCNTLFEVFYNTGFLGISKLCAHKINRRLRTCECVFVGGCVCVSAYVHVRLQDYD